MPPPPYQIEVDRRGLIAVVKLAGSVNMDVCDQVRDRLIEIVDDHPTTRLVLDLSGLDFICSVGLGGIIAAHLRCRHHNGGVRLVSPRPDIMELLSVTKLTTLFPIDDTVAAAIAAK
jgi:anti-sigma B factor antagonist